jgi:hypothetical protein
MVCAKGAAFRALGFQDRWHHKSASAESATHFQHEFSPSHQWRAFSAYF